MVVNWHIRVLEDFGPAANQSILRVLTAIIMANELSPVDLYNSGCFTGYPGLPLKPCKNLKCGP